MFADPSNLLKKDRVALILKALHEAQAAASREEALGLLDQVFRTVEDAHSGVPHEPHNKDRLYPPVTSMERQVEGKPWLRRYRHTSHYTLIADNGAIVVGRIIRGQRDGMYVIVGEETALDKPGADGLRVADLE